MAKTIKIVGVSGCGKTTLIKLFIEKYPYYRHMSYGQFISEHGDQAEKEWKRHLKQCSDIVLIDDHLEWGERDFVSLYREEGTLAVILITADTDAILARRIGDPTRARDLNRDTIELEQRISIDRAHHIANCLAVPICELHNASIDVVVAALEKIVYKVG